MSKKIRFISAGAGSGKTFRLTEEMEKALTKGRIRPAGIIGTTFTKKAARELRERVRQRLIQNGKLQLANEMEQAMIGTVNSVCGQLLKRFSFETGLSPELEVLPEEEGQLLFNQALEASISLEQVRLLNDICLRLDIQDWKTNVKHITDAARANNVNPKTVRGFGKKSADELLYFFPRPARNDLYAIFYKKITSAIKGIENNDDSTKGTKGYLDLLKRIQPDVKEKRLKWSLWVKLSKALPTKRSMALGESVQDVAIQYDKHPMLHKDIRQCCEMLFTIAAATLDQYQELKKKGGLIDFIDQEKLMLEALENASILQTLNEELDLLLVDEFQDTSPIQLALFLKLASAAEQVIFVGDVKQAIYGFRGTDPELMLAVLRAVRAEGGKTDVIEKSYRSRPALVAYHNAIFSVAFSDTIPKKQIELKPVRKEIKNESALEHWCLKDGSKGLRAVALAQGVMKLIESGHRVVDPLSNQVRPVRFEDIAVLARTNDNVELLAEALSAADIPVKRERAGLASTPEAHLALACLRRMADPYDTLASAEIVALSECKETGTWLQDRLEYLDSGAPGHLWGDSESSGNPLIKSLMQHRDRIRYLAPSEALAHAINVADVRRILVGWGPQQQRARQRLQNIDGLIGLAEEYEDHCSTQRQAATIAGFLLWFKELADAGMDHQPEDPKTNAVQMSTHHGAKGQEWPVVIATDFEGNLWSRLWQLNVFSESKTIDLNDPLSGRRIRYWPWPFGGHSAGINVKDRIQESETAKTILNQDIAEAKRLLYVSMTRARDLLILPLPEKKPTGPWMETLNAGWMVPNGKELKLPNKLIVPAAQREFEAKDFAESDKRDKYKPLWFGPRQDPVEKLPASVNPSSMSEAERASVVETKAIGKRIAIKGTPEMELVGNALHGIIAAEIVNPGLEDNVSTTQRIIDNYGLTRHLNAGDAISSACNFYDYIKATFQPKRIFIEYPVEHVLKNGQVVKGWIDVLIETKYGWVIIDHKASPRPRNEWETEALKYSGQLKAYKNGVEAATDKNVLASWIHLPVVGGMVHVAL
ncbi:UvrD-helicase domain-containing protein [Thermodesulfobacteriota bacterium]